MMSTLGWSPLEFSIKSDVYDEGRVSSTYYSRQLRRTLVRTVPKELINMYAESLLQK